MPGGIGLKKKNAKHKTTMKKHTTRSLLIDPVAKTVTEIMVPLCGNNHIHKLIGCESCDQIDFGSGVMLSIDDEGLYHIPRQPEPPHAVIQGFFVTHVNGMPRNFVSGKGVLWAYDAEGVTVDLPAWVTPALIRQHVAFVADRHRNTAADLCGEILSQAGIAFGPTQIQTHQRRYAEIVCRAMALTEK
jgi:hypothetical protein